MAINFRVKSVLHQQNFCSLGHLKLALEYFVFCVCDMISKFLLHLWMFTSNFRLHLLHFILNDCLFDTWFLHSFVHLLLLWVFAASAFEAQQSILNCTELVVVVVVIFIVKLSSGAYWILRLNSYLHTYADACTHANHTLAHIYSTNPSDFILTVFSWKSKYYAAVEKQRQIKNWEQKKEVSFHQPNYCPPISNCTQKKKEGKTPPFKRFCMMCEFKRIASATVCSKSALVDTWSAKNRTTIHSKGFFVFFSFTFHSFFWILNFIFFFSFSSSVLLPHECWILLQLMMWL